MDFDAESSSTEAVAFMTVSEAGAAEVPQNVADKSAARGEEAEKEEELHNTTALKSDVSNVVISNFRIILTVGVIFHLRKFILFTYRITFQKKKELNFELSCFDEYLYVWKRFLSDEENF